jgi:hypothetical protein
MGENLEQRLPHPRCFPKCAEDTEKPAVTRASAPQWGRSVRKRLKNMELCETCQIPRNVDGKGIDGWTPNEGSMLCFLPVQMYKAIISCL